MNVAKKQQKNGYFLDIFDTIKGRANFLNRQKS